jgi:VWFA-related protein
MIKQVKFSQCVGLVFFVTLAALAFWGTGSVSGQAPVVVRINQVDAAAFPHVAVYLTVADGNGLPVEKLTEANFLLNEDKGAVPASALNLSQTQANPLALSVALDVSGSMGGKPLEDTKAAATQLITTLAAEDEVALLSFNEVVSPQVTLTTDRATLLAAVEGLAAEGGTAFNDAVFEAVEQLTGHDYGRRAVIVLTDGENTSGDLTLDDAINRAKEVGVPVYVIGFGPHLQPDILNRLAQTTGGYFYQTPTSDEVGQSFDTVMRLLRQQYVLTFTSTLPADGAEHALQVQVTVAGAQNQTNAHFIAYPSQVDVHIPDLSDGDRVSGLVSLLPDIVAPAPVAEVVYSVDGNPLHTAYTAPFAYEWDTALFAPGLHTLAVQVTDQAGNTGTFASDLRIAAPIQVDILTPVAGAIISDTVTVQAVVTAAADVARVVLTINGEEAAILTAAPYTWDWDTSTLPTEEHTLSVTAYDVNGYEASDAVTTRVAFRGAGMGIWVAALVVLVSAGIILPLSWRVRQSRQH